MPDHHEPLCPRRRWYRAHHVTCQCWLIREVRAAERDRIVQGTSTLPIVVVDTSAFLDTAPHNIAACVRLDDLFDLAGGRPRPVVRPDGMEDGRDG